jgi:diguanylate cyclase (GGDEF)-like protein
MIHSLSKALFWQVDGPERHQVQLINVILVLMTAYFAVIGTINVLVFQEYPIALLDYAGMSGVILALVFFKRTGNLKTVSWLVTILLTTIIIAFIHIADGRAYSIMWITVLPPVAFFLLGRSAGAWLCSLVFSYVAVFMYVRIGNRPPAEITLASLLNIIEVMTAHWFLFRHYERSRADAFQELELLSETDNLTGLYNRNKLDFHLQQQFYLHQQSGHPLTLVMCDIDHFKQINDEYGHLTGDRVIKETAQLLKKHMRSTDICGRWGGEEFLIICPHTPGEAAAAIIAKLKQLISDHPFAENICISMSFGIACIDPGESGEQLLRRADDALYAAKRAGRNRFVLADNA